jgi:NAD(P)-dependent dehydrogenase (short-subunit alcohol dehydrogenase family)
MLCDSYVEHTPVTGCSTEFGQAIATHIHNAGHNIVATARNANSLAYLPDEPNVLKLSLDVTFNNSVVLAINTAVTKFGQIDVVINNAGYGSMCEVEGFPDDEARMQMETNFWGPVRITKEALRVFREVNAPGWGGTIVQVSATSGFLSFEGLAFYNAR